MEQILELQTAWMVFMGICATIITIGGASSVIDRWRNRAKKPLDDNANTLTEHGIWLASDKKRIEQLEADQEELKEQNKLMLKGIVMLMKHELDGNHTKQLEAVSNEIHDYLFENVGG